jgi:hypothetical protein
MIPLMARKTADTARASTTTTTADPELQFTLEANATYAMDGFLKYDADATAKISIDFTGPVGVLGEWVGWGAGAPAISTNGSPGALISDTSSTRGYMIRNESNDVEQLRTFGALGVGNILTILINGTIRNTTAGTYTLDWAQVNSSATATTIYTDSWLRLQRVA